MGGFEGKVAIVTGATNGIGRETAIQLAAEGAKVIVTGRNAAAGAETVALATAAGGSAMFFQQDVGSEADWMRLIAVVDAAFGRLDILVNNAGQFLIKPLTETTLDDFNQQYQVNVEGGWLGIKYATPLLRRSGGGAIVNVSSLMGLVGYPQSVAYCASKGALTALTKTAAIEGAPDGIRVNSLHPGVIWTKMLEDIFGDGPIRQALIDETPIRLEGTPEHMADGILYLASDAARHVTGIELTIDGGRGAD
jgi:cyclopentanol dehydrogenase